MGGNAWVGCLSDDVQKYLQQEGFYVSEVNRYSPEVEIRLTMPHWRD